ncbi:MAG TPA: hypothetical protein PK347_00355 [Burkholderiaceae bacterium]|nr:hypothetical protein [Burkholderiaceae bacterium]
MLNVEQITLALKAHALLVEVLENDKHPEKLSEAYDVLAVLRLGYASVQNPLRQAQAKRLDLIREILREDIPSCQACPTLGFPKVARDGVETAAAYLLDFINFGGVDQ